MMITSRTNARLGLRDLFNPLLRNERYQLSPAVWVKTDGLLISSTRQSSRFHGESPVGLGWGHGNVMITLQVIFRRSAQVVYVSNLIQKRGRYVPLAVIVVEQRNKNKNSKSSSTDTSTSTTGIRVYKFRDEVVVDERKGKNG